MAGLWDALKQYIGDALPGGALNPETAPVAKQANYLSGILDPASQVSQDATNWHKRTQNGLMDQLAGRDTPEAEQAYQTMMQLAGMAPIGMVSPIKKLSREAYLMNKEIFDNAHKSANLEFQALPISETSDAVRIYRSPKYGNKAPSEYMVGIVDGEPAYIRKSDHWGQFTTNVKAGTSDAKAMGLEDEVGDQFGRVGFKQHDWALQGGIGSQFQERAEQARAFRNAMTLEQIYGTNREVAEKLWDEYYALTHTGKREAGYIPLSKLLEKKQP